MQALRVTVPCSTSNLGAGFDCIGLALDRHLVATFEPGTEARLERSGTLADAGGTDIVQQLLAERGIHGRLVLDSTIPIGKGLGSSAAATVAGLAIAAAVKGTLFDYDVALQAAAALEGHPDNAAPSILGGLVAVVGDATHYRALALHLSEEIRFVFAAPHAIVSTKAARKALPAQVTHAVAAQSVARGIALVEGLAEADADLLRIGFADELHVPYRLGMIPGGSHALQAALDAGAWAVTISGSGSGLIAVCQDGRETQVRDAMASAFAAATAQPAVALLMNPDFAGTQVEKIA
jgi:homoserine kinase